jgi:hypothetical protein
MPSIDPTKPTDKLEGFKFHFRIAILTDGFAEI